ncbi:MAG: multiprotein bridging factor aMBF1 [Natronomonas sp.]|jgi:putative transcription factor|uniref:TIGR00270 family protein n=1 Tax=Natronomonas salsuginis TaxID=2217661 RepID=A0A4U5JIG5_9EURY|nr:MULTISPECIES: multiprotein bridging factor aMBF1 [Natronomonas]MDR9380821.1 multiprotein bridging factor aMBF1 [Natronomonas sp.]MDR9429806.1 multiprotein bridging factor aMBF1 [Natronomonas sp.]TKR27858.1 TIGR00270 family protein [Natronomonas salsuginis]
MVQCEMCGTETGSPKTVKIEGAELEVCDDCADFGTEVRTEQPSSSSTKYSTSSSSGSGSSASSRGSSGTSGGGGSGQRRDMFDEMDEVVQDYDDRIRTARESKGLTQEELAKQLNEKASLIRKLERGDVLPSDSVQRKLERELGIDLTMGGSGDDDAEWSAGSSTSGTTLGDVVKRKD